MASVSMSMTVSTVKARVVTSFGLEDGDCKGFRNINKSIVCGEHWNKIFKVKLLMFKDKKSPAYRKVFSKGMRSAEQLEVGISGLF
jgi:hypothetical protein